jgi:putative PIN family toxin of toxin-antitoxin system
MRRVVLDTNVLVSALLVPVGRPADILKAWRSGALEMAVSVAILDELSDVLGRPDVLRRFGVSLADARQAAADVRSKIKPYPGKAIVGAVPNDPRDDHVISAAVEAGADCIVTGDRHLLDLGSYEGIPILTPAEFVEQLHG